MDASSRSRPPGDAPSTGGLSTAEAAARRERCGPNELPHAPPPSPVRMFVAELTHFFALMLWVASALAVVAGMPALGAAIAVVVVVNATFAFVQQRRAERAAARLRDLLPTGVKVRRDGRTTVVPSSDVVPGDLVVLEAGDRTPADARLVRAEAVLVDESMLTGESVAVPRAADEVVHAGTFLVGGDGEAVVVATGAQTRLASIADLTASVHRRPSPLTLELNRVVRTLATVALGVGSGFFVLAWLLGTPAADGFLFAVGVTVALVPEGLLPTVTLSLAIGAQRMAADQALVRHLEAVETLGSTTYICTDKTGTLTRNQMSVLEVWTPAGTTFVTGDGYEPTGVVVGDGPALDAARRAAMAARAASRGRAVAHDGRWVNDGDPMEAAIDALAHRLGATSTEATLQQHFPFDPQRRRESVVLSGGEVVVKGAPDTVLPLCAADAGASEALEDLARRGLRVLAVAHRSVAAAPTTPEMAEADLALLGLLAFEDPPRPQVRESIAACRRAGIRLAMLTGDHPTTARAIAVDIGLLDPDGTVLVGTELPDDDAVLGALLDKGGVVLSRVTPEQKLRVARVLQERGHVVAMTGDGVNDAPALRVADIGIAMGRSGTDVAREAADLVLLDDDFTTIVKAIEHGRATYSNIRRFLTYHLTDNVAELTPFAIWALSGGQFPLALGVLQILCLDIGTDLVPALALGAEPPSPGVMSRPPERRHLMDRALLRRVFGVLGPTEAAVEMAAFVVALLAAGWAVGEPFPTGAPVAAASGAAFAAVIAGQSANGFACRSATRPAWALGWTSNRLLLVGVALAWVVLAILLIVPFLADLLEHAAPPLAAWPVVATAVPAVLVADALHKRQRRGNHR